MLSTVHIGNIHSAVSANESVSGFGNEDSAPANLFLSHGTAAFGQRNFRQTGISTTRPRPTRRIATRVHSAEPHNSPFRLGNDFVFDDQDVAAFQRQFLVPHSATEFLDKIIAGENCSLERHGDNGDRGRIRHYDSATTAGCAAPRTAISRSSALTNFRARRCDCLSPGVSASCRRSSGVSMSSPIRGNESTTQEVLVAIAATRCGIKLSLPNRRGNSAAGRRRTALLPRLSIEGTSTEPFGGALS